MGVDGRACRAVRLPAKALSSLAGRGHGELGARGGGRAVPCRLSARVEDEDTHGLRPGDDERRGYH